MFNGAKIFMGMGFYDIYVVICIGLVMKIPKRYDTYMFVLKIRYRLLNPIHGYGVKITPYPTQHVV